MLTPIITEDKARLKRQIDALKEELKKDLPAKDRAIFKETLRVYEEALREDEIL